MDSNIFCQLLSDNNILIQPLSQAGSNRQYFRLAKSDATTLIGVIGTSREENHAFIVMSRHFASVGLNVPSVIAVSDDEMAYIQTDLGNVSLFDAIAQGRQRNGEYSEYEVSLIAHTIELLPRFQVHGAQDLDFNICYPQPEFDVRNVMFDLNYFKYCFLKPTGTDFHELRLDDEFQMFAHEIVESSGYRAFMVRDFQSRNVMLVDGAIPYYIDYQGGRKGPILYDLVSFLWQASAHFSANFRNRMIDVYFEALSNEIPKEKMPNRSILPKLVLFRTLQVLGAYGYRGYFERKSHFIASIPSAINNLKEVIPCLTDNYPHLRQTLEDMTNKVATISKETDISSYRLHVRIYSFSYKRGIPEDFSGNGGGYVFDCRGTHNPGRYDEYKPLTGLDKPVIDFLERDGEIMTFLEHVYHLADMHVQRYIERGFSNLMFCFGCTGGQHRSVYSAQHLADYISSKYNVDVTLTHREQGITKHYTERPL